MEICDVKTGFNHEILIERVFEQDFKKITKSKYYFNWQTEKKNQVYKLRVLNTEEILGLMSLVKIEQEKRIEIKLLAVSRENRGSKKNYEGIAGNLIAYACREARMLYGFDACVSLIPKTSLKRLYMSKYFMLDAGWHLFLYGSEMTRLINKFRL